MSFLIELNWYIIYIVSLIDIISYININKNIERK